MTRTRLLWLAAVVVLAVLVAFQVIASSGDRAQVVAQADIPTVAPGVDVLDGIAQVPIRIRSHDYRRDAFGDTWTDDNPAPGGHNGCDTRNDILAAQRTAVRYRGRSRYVVIAGSLPAEPYTGRRIEFRKAAANKVQVDHLYPLARAWDMGAARWPLRRRIDFANDQAANLLAVDGPANASKNDSGPGEWLPINRNYRCTYVLRYLQVARKYALPITANDRDAAQAITRSSA
jgi:hypothetical protein